MTLDGECNLIVHDTAIELDHHCLDCRRNDGCVDIVPCKYFDRLPGFPNRNHTDFCSAGNFSAQDTRSHKPRERRKLDERLALEVTDIAVDIFASRYARPMSRDHRVASSRGRISLP